MSRTYHHLTALSIEGNQSKVASRSACCWIDDQKQRLRPYERHGRLIGQHSLYIRSAKALLQRIERQSRKFGLNEIRPIGHDCLEPLVSQRGLPRRHQMKHVPTCGCGACLSTRVACERHLELRKDWQSCDGVLDLEEARVKIDLFGHAYACYRGGTVSQTKRTDLGCERRDAYQRRHPHEQKRRHRLIKEALIHVGGLLQYDDVAAGALGSACGVGI